MILAVILWLLAHLSHPFTDVGEPVPPPAAFAVPAPALPTPLATPPAVTVGESPTTPHSAPPAADPGCAPGEMWQGDEFGCVALQREWETVGRGY